MYVSVFVKLEKKVPAQYVNTTELCMYVHMYACFHLHT